MNLKGKVEILRRQQFPDQLSNHLVCHIALRNFQNFLPSPLNTSSLPKCVALLLFSIGHLSAQCSWHTAEEEVAHYKLPGRKRVISLSWKLSICQTAAAIVGQIVSNSHPTSPILHRPSLICSLPVSPSLFLPSWILNGNQTGCLPIHLESVEKEGQPMEICPKN